MTRRLAFEGGAPRFAAPRWVSRPDTSDPEPYLEAVRGILASRWLTNDGAVVRALERRIAERMGVRHCVAVANGTIGLELALAALDLPSDGEVILPSFTFVATAHAVTRIGLRPVFCDVDETTWTIDPARAGELVGPRTVALLPVHLFGNAAPVAEISALARARDLRVVYDAAHVFGGATDIDGRSFGAFGDAEVLSFHATKIFTTFEGGAVLTDSDARADRLRLLRNFGFRGYDRVDALGTNAKLSEISAAWGLATIDRVPARVAHNRAVFERLRAGLRGVPGLAMLEPSPGVVSNHHYLVLRVDAAEFGLSRDAVYRFLWSENVRARRYFHPGCHRMSPYRDDPTFRAGPLPVTERMLAGVLCLPTGTDWSLEDTDAAVELLRAARARAGEIEDWARARPDPA